MNNNNALGLKQGSWVRVLDLKEGITVMLPTVKQVANARILKVNNDGSTEVHWDSNYNTEGDFRTELMHFSSHLVLNVADKAQRNKVRKARGLVLVA